MAADDKRPEAENLVRLSFQIFFFQGEDPFSMRNILFMGLKLFLAIAGGSSSNIEKADSSPMQVNRTGYNIQYVS